ncbi:hypothetical protein [Polymorphospora sp. NPDC050346]|uniref:hypothetical protein n=1 Tax=Polymorphospora sp. NPDC050346 TaxID=3155780 RepID=UPI003407C125
MSQKLVRRMLAALVVVAVGVVVGATPAAAGPVESGNGAAMPRYYEMAATTTGADLTAQCALPVGERQGPWLCGNPETPPQVNAGVCSTLGCWYYNANYWAEFSGDGLYGYGGTHLGAVEFFFQVRFAGSTSTSRPFQLESTRGTRNVRATGERIYFSSARPEGWPVSDGATYRTWTGGTYSAYTLINAFGSGGYSLSAASVAHAGVAHQWDWMDPSSAYPGRWWFFIKSPKFARNSAGAYILANPPEMGAAWYGSGWSPS